MITFDLFERKLNQAGQPGDSLKRFEDDATSQGIDLGKPKRDAHHVDYPDAKFIKGGKPARTRDGKVIGGSAKGDKITKNTHGAKLKDAVVSSGRVDKRDAAKAKRKEVAAQNKANKLAARDKFGRPAKKYTPIKERVSQEWWVNMWREDVNRMKEINRIDNKKQQSQAPQKQQQGLIGTRETPKPTGGAPKPQWGSGKNKGKLPQPPKIDRQKEKQEKLAQERKAADAAGKEAAKKARADKMKEEGRKADANAKKLEAKVKAQPKYGSRLGGQKQTMKTGPVSRPSTMKVKEKEEKKPAGPSKPMNDKPSGKIDTTKRAKAKTNQQMADLRKDSTSAGGRVKKSLGGDMFIRDKKTDTKDTRDNKKRMRNNARLDAAGKAGKAVGAGLKDFTKRATDMGSAGDPTAGGGSKPEGTAKAKNWGTK